MAYLSVETLLKMNFKHLGKNVKISDKASIYDPELIEIGDFSRIDDFCVISGKVKLGRNVCIAVHCNVAGGEKGVRLDDFSTLAYGCHVFSQSDDYSGETLTNPTIPTKYKKEIKLSVHLKRHVIVGACSVILPGVVVEEGTSIGAMSLITKSTESWSIYIGIPAKKLRARKRDLLELEKQFLSAPIQ